jgi:photosystem II stability/assembly factor-like uncharacterized protein
MRVVSGAVGLIGMVLGSLAVAGPPARLATPSARPISDAMSSEAFRADARLNDVCFVDPQSGWAVGDRGTIWHTDDAGQHWTLQSTPVVCPLYSVFFLDRNTGWAAGGAAHPYTHTSSGVVLWTRDGGKQWQTVDKLCLPLLRQVRFFDARRGWAVGATSAMFPSGMFWTDSGGRGWQPFPGGTCRGWLAGAMLDPTTGVLAGRSGSLANMLRAEIAPPRSGAFGLRSLTAVSLVPPVYGWLAGDGGLVMLTADVGTSWQTPPAEPPRAVAPHFDFAALAVRGPKCWVAGTPGTRVLFTPDAGHTWQALATGQSLGIRALAMVDDAHGWAVGELGTILATADGGQTWQRQRAGGTRAAVLGMFAQAEDVPWELVARLGGNEGFLCDMEVIGRRDVEVAPRAPLDVTDRLQEAVVAAGGSASSTAWQFPLRQAGLNTTEAQIVEAWNVVHDGRGLAVLDAHLVRQIRLWRPEVIVTADPHATGDAASRVIAQAIVRAVERAADAAAMPEQIAQAGLAPWRVKKVYAATGPGDGGPADLTSVQLAPRLGRTLADVAAGPRGLVETEFRVPPQTLGFHLLQSQVADDASRGDFFSGIPLWPGGEARRQLIEPPPETVESLARMAQRRRNTEAIVEQADRSPQKGLQLAAQASQLAGQLDADGGAWILYHLAQRYHHGGRWEMAAETYRMLLDRYPDHALARPATLWLIQYYASTEVGWRVQGGQRRTAGEGSVGTAKPGWRLDGPQREVAGAIQPVSAIGVDPLRLEDRAAKASALANEIERSQPALFAEPSLQFPLAAAYRQQGLGRQADRFYLTASRAASRDAWWACAESERWLAEPKGVPPKPVLRAITAPAPPQLDGRLDDPVWQKAPPAMLRSAQDDDAEWPATVRLAYDREFLYVAVACREAPSVKYQPGTGSRPRDADLSARDRVELYLDVDRDFVTAYHLAVDHRGWTAEDCWGDRTWNPTWYVAAGNQAGVWTAEAAIPLDQLAGRYPSARDVWAVGLQRTVPGVGFQAWSTPASTEGMPEGFGYLIFE